MFLGEGCCSHIYLFITFICVDDSVFSFWIDSNVRRTSSLGLTGNFVLAERVLPYEFKHSPSAMLERSLCLPAAAAEVSRRI